jgi:hypothetical protein
MTLCRGWAFHGNQLLCRRRCTRARMGGWAHVAAAAADCRGSQLSFMGFVQQGIFCFIYQTDLNENCMYSINYKLTFMIYYKNIILLHDILCHIYSSKYIIKNK